MIDMVYYLTLDLSSSRIQMAALGHTSTPFCFVIRQLLGFPRSSPFVWGPVWWHLPSSSSVVLAFSCNLSVWYI